MTREEAIEELEQRLSTLRFVGGTYVDCVNGEALEMAVEALEHQEIIRCKDCCFYAISKEKRSWCKDMLRRIQPEDFCSHARRREE